MSSSACIFELSVPLAKIMPRTARHTFGDSSAPVEMSCKRFLTSADVESTPGECILWCYFCSKRYDRVFTSKCQWSEPHSWQQHYYYWTALHKDEIGSELYWMPQLGRVGCHQSKFASTIRVKKWTGNFLCHKSELQTGKTYTGFAHIIDRNPACKKIRKVQAAHSCA